MGLPSVRAGSGWRSGGFDDRGCGRPADTLKKGFDDFGLSDVGDLVHLGATMAAGQSIDEQDAKHQLGPGSPSREGIG